jgi:hypothetical protein
MKMTVLTSTLVATGGLLFLAGCVSTGSGASAQLNEYSTSCMFEVNPPGSYVWSDGDSEVKAGGGGTAEGAAAMNACIRRKAAAAGNPIPAGLPTERTEVVVSGGTVTETYTYGQPPAAAVAPSASRKAATERSCRNRNVLSGGTGYNGCT